MKFISTFDPVFFTMFGFLIVTVLIFGIAGVVADIKGKTEVFVAYMNSLQIHFNLAWIVLFIGCGYVSLEGTTTFLTMTSAIGIISRITTTWFKARKKNT